jgi:predicted nucleic acid-binding protein
MEVENVQNIPTVDVWRVTGPDPSRAEMAMHIMAALASTEGLKKYHHMAEDAVAMADALIAALTRKEKQ